MYIIVYQQNPMINFRKKSIESIKIPNLKRSENSLKMHEIKHENMKIRTKGGVMVLPALREKNLAKIR